MNRDELNKEMERLVQELAVSATLTCNIYARAKELSKEIDRQKSES